MEDMGESVSHMKMGSTLTSEEFFGQHDCHSSGFVHFLFAINGIIIPLGVRLNHCKSHKKVELGRILLLTASIILLLVTAWSSSSLDFVPAFIFLPLTGLIIHHVLFFESKSKLNSISDDEAESPFTIHCLGDVLALVILGFGAYMPLFGLYYYLCATKTPDFIGDILGHLIPGSFIALFAQLSLHFYKKKDYMSLQRVEGTIMVVAGTLDMFLHIWGNHGSIFRSFWEVNTNWMKDEQHILDLAIWIVSGLIGLGFYHARVQTGVHALIPALCNLVTMLGHPQETQLMAVLHWGFGGIVLIGSLFRLVERIPEYCLFAAIGGLAFIFGTPLLGSWASTVFHPTTYFLYLFVTVGFTWGYNFALWNTKLVEDRDKIGSKNTPI